jgi:hypothetical protein
VDGSFFHFYRDEEAPDKGWFQGTDLVRAVLLLGRQGRPRGTRLFGSDPSLAGDHATGGPWAQTGIIGRTITSALRQLEGVSRAYKLVALVHHLPAFMQVSIALGASYVLDIPCPLPDGNAADSASGGRRITVTTGDATQSSPRVFAPLKAPCGKRGSTEAT